MKRSTRRAGWAAAWIALAVMGPCVAWWVVGTRGVARERRGIEEEARRAAQDLADASALRIGLALESLRERESRRPWPHWPSARPREDRAILARFEIDEGRAIRVAGRDGPGPSLESALGSLAHPLTVSLADPPARDELIEPEPLSAAAVTDAARPPGAGLLAQGPFQWRALALDGTPTLAAVREIRTTRGARVQGFVLDPHGRPPGGDGGADGPRLVHGPAGAVGEAEIPIAGSAWRTVVDPTPALERGRARAAGIARRFHVTFALGSSLAALAGTFGIGWVLQRERSAARRERWATAAAHELRSPLAGLRLHGDLLAGRLDRPDEARATLAVIEREIASLERVVDNVVESGRSRRGALPPEPETGDVGDDVRAIVEAARPMLAARDADVSIEIEPGPLPATYDPRSLRQVLGNLLDNAARYGEGTVRVRVRAAPDRIAIDVLDDGPGIPAEIERRVLRRGRDAPPRPDGGLGIGLALARRLTLAMGGELRRVPTRRGTHIVVALRRDTDIVLDGPD